MNKPIVSVIVEATDPAVANAAVTIRGLQQQVSSHFAPIWGVDAELRLVQPDRPIPDSYWLVILDDSDQAYARGYHELAADGLPLGKVFARTARESGGDWTITASHELLELLADPELVRTQVRRLDDGSISTYALEICDPCQAPQDSYIIRIDNVDVKLSDFVYPAWFDQSTRAGAQRDYLSKIKVPFGLLTGGYATVMSSGDGSAWRQIEAVSTRTTGPDSGSGRSSFPRPGSRRHRRRILDQWERSHSAEERLSKATQIHSLPPRGILFSHLSRTGQSKLALHTHTTGVKYVLEEIDRAARTLTKRDISGRTLDSHNLAAMLQQARVQLARSDGLAGSIPEEIHASMVLSAMVRTPSDAAAPSTGSGMGSPPLRALDRIGLGQYDMEDPRWISTLMMDAASHPIPFPTHLSLGVDPVTAIKNQVKIAIVGDWGTGNDSSQRIAIEMKKCQPDHTIHLGDVYYCGTPDEELSKFLPYWQPGSDPNLPSLTLNGNHEMYSGGYGYFQTTLDDSKFLGQKGLSYFALLNDNWLIVGLDTAYHATNLFLDGCVDDFQLDWMVQQIKLARAAKGPALRVILLTHHDGVDVDTRLQETNIKSLWYQINTKLDGKGPDFWYWGHVHAAIAYQPIPSDTGSVNARCVGHGGIPWVPYKTIVGLGNNDNVRFEWAETTYDPSDPSRALNGFVLLTFNGVQLIEEFRDEYGNLRHSHTF